jgi:hypothetical protein
MWLINGFIAVRSANALMGLPLLALDLGVELE